MVEKLRTGKWAHQKATPEEVEDKVHEIMDYIVKYGWENRTVAPYGFAINVVDFLKPGTNYSDYTASSKGVILSELNGFIEILNKWIEQENEPKVTIRLLVGNKAGQVKVLPASVAADYLECEFAEIVEGE